MFVKIISVNRHSNLFAVSLKIAQIGQYMFKTDVRTCVLVSLGWLGLGVCGLNRMKKNKLQKEKYGIYSAKTSSGKTLETSMVCCCPADPAESSQGSIVLQK